MTNVTSSQDVLNQLNAPGVTTATNTSTAVNAKDFITLMLAQLQNQDPLNPMDNTEMVSQLAQISTVQSVNQLNTSFATLSSSLSSLTGSFANNQALQSALLVGKNAQVKSNQATLASTGGIAGAVIVPSTMSNVTVNIQNAAGQTVSQIPLGSVGANTAFSWDGMLSDGTRAPAGTYTISATGTANGQTTGLSTAVNYRINSVSYAASTNQVMLGLDNYTGLIPFSSVISVTA